MKFRIALGLLSAAWCSGEAAAQCAAVTQVQNVSTGAQVTLTFTSTFPSHSGTMTVAGVTGTWSGNKSGTDFAQAFDQALAGATPAGFASIAMSGTYNSWNAGTASGATVPYTHASQSLCSAVTFPTPTVTGGNVLAPSVSACTNGTVGAQNLINLLNLSLVCGRPGASYPGNANDRWQEQHRAGSQLWDYKLGTSTVDPTTQVGSWSVSGAGATSTVTHNYGGANTFTWTVHNNGTFYSFCTGVGGAEHVRAFITTPGTLATASCGSYPP